MLKMHENAPTLAIVAVRAAENELLILFIGVLSLDSLVLAVSPVKQSDVSRKLTPQKSSPFAARRALFLCSLRKSRPRSLLQTPGVKSESMLPAASSRRVLLCDAHHERRPDRALKERDASGAA